MNQGVSVYYKIVQQSEKFSGISVESYETNMRRRSCLNVRYLVLRFLSTMSVVLVGSSDRSLEPNIKNS